MSCLFNPGKFTRIFCSSTNNFRRHRNPPRVVQSYPMRIINCTKHRASSSVGTLSCARILLQFNCWHPFLMVHGCICWWQLDCAPHTLQIYHLLRRYPHLLGLLRLLLSTLFTFLEQRVPGRRSRVRGGGQSLHSSKFSVCLLKTPHVRHFSFVECENMTETEQRSLGSLSYCARFKWQVESGKWHAACSTESSC